MDVRGECLCGGCVWRAEIDPDLVFLCHCEDCQVQSSSAFRSTAIVAPDRFRLEVGELQTWVKRAESGAARTLAFCATCGTHVYGGPGDGGPGMLSLRVGPLDARPALKPAGQVWCRSRLDWLDELGEIPGMPTQPGIGAGEGRAAGKGEDERR